MIGAPPLNPFSVIFCFVFGGPQLPPHKKKKISPIFNVFIFLVASWDSKTGFLFSLLLRTINCSKDYLNPQKFTLIFFQTFLFSFYAFRVTKLSPSSGISEKRKLFLLFKKKGLQLDCFKK